MALKKSRKSRRSRDKVAYSDLISVVGGKAWHNWVVVLVIAVLGITPWLDPGVTRPYPGITVLLGGLAACLAGIAYPALRLGPRSRVTLLVAACLPLWMALCCLGSLDLFRSLQTTAAWVGAAGIFALISLASSSGFRWYCLVLGLICSASLLCLYGFAHMDPKVGIAATFSNRDSFSVIPMVALFLALALVQHPASPIRALAWIQVVLFGLTLVRTTSRSSLVGLFVGMVTIGILSSLQPDKKLSGKAKLIGIFLPLVLLLLAAGSGLLNPLSGRIGELSKGKDSQGIAMREDVLVYGLRASLARPVLGSGPGTFALAYQEYRPPSVLPDYMYVNVAHNDYVEVAVEMGWPGFCLFGFLWLLVFIRAIRLLRQKAGPWEACCCAGAAAALLGFSLFNFIISIPCLLFWEFTVLALLHSIPTSTPPVLSGRGKVGRMVQGLLLMVLGCWAVHFGYRCYRSTLLEAAASKLLVAMRWEEALPKLDQALRLTPDNPHLYLARGSLQGRQNQLMKAPPSKAADEDFEKAWKLSPRDLKISRGIINYYEATGRLARAQEILETINEYRPYVKGRFRELVRLQLQRQDFAGAAKTAHDGRVEDPELNEVLVPTLVSLELKQENGSIQLLKEWCQREGQLNLSLVLAKGVATELLQHREPKAAWRVLEFVQSVTKGEDDEVVYLWSVIYQQLGRKKDQLAQLETLLQRTPTPGKEEPFANQALVDWARMQPDFLSPGATYRLLSSRLRDQPGSVALRMIVSEILLRRKQVDAATEIVSQGLDSAPENAAMLARMGVCSQAQGLSDVARGYFEQAIRLDPKNREARQGLANKPPVWQ